MNTWTVDVLDAEGDEWKLLAPPVKHRIEPSGLCELWMMVCTGPEALTRHYQLIPVPCFTEWWS